MANQSYRDVGGFQINPLGSNTQNRSFLSLGGLQPQKVAVGTTPFSQDDWQNPTLWRGIPIALVSQPNGSPRNLNLLVGRDALPHRWREWPDPTLRRMTPTGVLSQPLGSSRIDILTGKDKLPFRNLYWVESLPPQAVPPRNVQINAQPLGSPRLDNLLVGQDKLPFRQNDWPVTRGAAYDRAINSQMNGVPESELSPAAPFGQDDWPNPTLRLSSMQALIAQAQGAALVLNVLIGQDTFFGSPGQVLDYDWPVPLGPPKWIEAVSSQPQGAPATVTFGTAAPFSQDDWPNPRAPGRVTDTQQQGSPLNLTILPGQDALPVRQQQWPNPVPPVSRVAALAAQNLGSPLLLTLLPGQDQLPDRQTDWPNPRLSVSYGVAITSQAQGQAVPIEEAEDSTAQYDWPVPRGAKQPTQTQPIGSPPLLTLLPGQDAFPVRQQDWPVPLPPLARIVAITAQPLGQSIPIEDAEVATSQQDWPVPKGPRQPVQTQPIGTSILLTLLPGQDQFPIRQRDWPNPTLAKSAYAADTGQLLGSPLNLTTLVGQDALPFNQGQWPNPRGPQPVTQTQPQGQGLVIEEAETVFRNLEMPDPVLGISWRVAVLAQAQGSPTNVTILPGQDALPFRQSDWPVPIAPVSRVAALLSQPQGQPPNYQAAALFPHNQTDWPDPRGAAQPIGVAAQPQGSPLLLTTLPGQDQFPVRQQSWPVPRGPQQPIQTQPLGQTFTVEETEFLPFNLDDWPVPHGAGVPLAVTVQPNGSALVLTTLVGKDALPFRKLEWPNPRGPIPPVQTQPQGIPDLYLSPAVPGAQLDWPLPIRPPQPIQTQLQGAPRLLNLLVGKDSLPVRQQDWPLPRRATVPVQTQPQGFPAAFTAAAVPVVPVPWAAPRGPVAPVQTQILGTPILLNLLPGQDRLPIRQQQWPNPGLAVSRVAAIDAQALGGAIDFGTPIHQTDWPNPLRAADRHPSLSSQRIGGVTPTFPFPVGKENGPNPVLGISPWVAITAQPFGCPSVLTLYPGTDAFPIRQQSWPVPPGWPPRTQTQRQGVSPNQRRPAPPPIINKPCNSATLVPPILDASKVAVDLGASKTNPSLGGSEIPVILDGDKSAPDLSGEVKNDGC